MKTQIISTGFICSSIPLILGLGVSLIGISIYKNESKLLRRRIELEEALLTKPRLSRKKLLFGNS